MKLFAALLLFTLSFLTSEENKEKIPWTETKQLTWDDFKGTPPAGANFVASANSGMAFSFSYSEKNGKQTMQHSVTCNFYPQLSWFKPGKVSNYILKHEQTHFDISELHARILRKRLAEAEFSKNVKEKIEALYRKTEQERQNLQDQYDLETDHSKNKAAEYRWRQKIANQLRAYERWK
ncbi:DUF922 domain-containing protein [Marixanthomonas spongiae]|uniref:DUF922 domain-containing protein n=1 Tax=Marixanthomonas spongiae TaxID=2174845 RepID=A0A2U0HXB8_9FLAO|nr:DUF922 domain-containing protein [Marixanthomonas spongiae]PVW13505.1 DUF922 domain-containing protein [Marixanthomonas spongiae]